MENRELWESEHDELEKLKKENKSLHIKYKKLLNVMEILTYKIIHHYIIYAESLIEYNKFINSSEYDELTQEEFNLLKEYLHAK